MSKIAFTMTKFIFIKFQCPQKSLETVRMGVIHKTVMVDWRLFLRLSVAVQSRPQYLSSFATFSASVCSLAQYVAYLSLWIACDTLLLRQVAFWKPQEWVYRCHYSIFILGSSSHPREEIHFSKQFANSPMWKLYSNKYRFPILLGRAKCEWRKHRLYDVTNSR